MRFRVNAYHTSYGPGAAFREIPTEIKSLAALHAPEIIRSIASFKKGLVLVVGPTGSGKSTLVSLIPRLLDAPDNSVLIDGIPIRHYKLEQLRQSIGFVPQETFLFSDSLAENISFGINFEPPRRRDTEKENKKNFN